jgi:hypothetical protein
MRASWSSRWSLSSSRLSCGASGIGDEEWEPSGFAPRNATIIETPDPGDCMGSTMPDETYLNIYRLVRTSATTLTRRFRKVPRKRAGIRAGASSGSVRASRSRRCSIGTPSRRMLSLSCRLRASNAGHLRKCSASRERRTDPCVPAIVPRARRRVNRGLLPASSAEWSLPGAAAHGQGRCDARERRLGSS